MRIAVVRVCRIKNERFRGTAKVGGIDEKVQKGTLYCGHESDGGWSAKRRGRPKRRLLDIIWNDLSERTVGGGRTRPSSMQAYHKKHRPQWEKRCGRRRTRLLAANASLECRPLRYKYWLVIKPDVHTNDFAPIHGRRAHIHTALAENNTSTFDSTFRLPQALCEYARGDRESGRNR